VDQTEYDNWTQNLYQCVDKMMEIGSDDPDATAQDIKDIVDRRIEEAKEG